MSDIKQEVLDLAKETADHQGVEIFDVEILGRGKLLLRVIIDKEGGVTLNDCEKFSKSLSAVLDVEDLFRGAYILEVSSPGLDRPLKGIKDFKKYTGKLARVVTREKVQNQKFFLGRIIGVSDDSVRLLVNGNEIDIPFDRISKARLEVEFKCQKNSAM